MLMQILNCIFFLFHNYFFLFIKMKKTTIEKYRVYTINNSGRVKNYKFSLFFIQIKKNDLSYPTFFSREEAENKI